MSPNPMILQGLGGRAVDVTKSFEFKMSGAIDVSKPHKFVRCGAMSVTNLINLQALGPGMQPTPMNL